MTAEQKNTFLKQVFPNLLLDKINAMSDDERQSLLFEQAERLLAMPYNGDVARFYAYTVLKDMEDGEVTVSPAFASDDSQCGCWLVRLAKLLAGLLNSNVNLALEACGLPLFTTDAAQTYPTDDKHVFPDGPTKFHDDLLRLFMRQNHKPYVYLPLYMVKVICKRALEWAMCHNPVIQDYFAQQLHKPSFKDDTEREKYREECWEAMLNIHNHLLCGRENGLDDDGQFIIDALWGFVPHPYEDNYVTCAKEIKNAAQSLLHERDYQENKKEYVKTVLEKSSEIAGEHDVDFDIHEWNISYSYLAYWIEYYYGNHVK